MKVSAQKNSLIFASRAPSHRSAGFFAAILSAFFLAACSREPDAGLTGYVEADLLYLAPQDAGVVGSLAVREGDQVKAGDILFTLDPARLSLAAQQATALAQGAAARATDGGVLAKQVAEAEAALVLAEQTFNRSRLLVKDGAVSKEKFDVDAAGLAAAKARLDMLRAERSAGMREYDSATAAAALAGRRLSDLETPAPSDGTIERIYRRPGEVVAPGEPVVALLAREHLKIRFFAAEPMLSSLAMGESIAFSCDGCAQPRRATISFIASEPQYTPPVIYSLKEREKLVFLIEARPDDPAGLRPGLPVSVHLE